MILTDDKYLLLIDTSTEVCSVALAHPNGVVAQELEPTGSRHSALIGDFAEKVLRHLPEGASLGAVAVAEGPGSYTGLRIAASFAKAICMVRRIPLVAVSTPEVMLCRYLSLYSEQVAESSIFMPMIDARRMEVYTALYRPDGSSMCDVRALILEDREAMAEVSRLSEGREVIYFGDGAEKAQQIMAHSIPSSRFVDGIRPQAGAMLPVVLDRLTKGVLCDIAYWTPFYLKEYEAKISTNKVLGNVRT